MPFDVSNAVVLTKEMFEEYLKLKHPAIGRYIIGPEIAKYILDGYNDQNRPFKKSTDLIKNSISKNEWVFTMQTIAFNTKEHLQDGQNRLLACLNASEPIDTLIAWGADPKGRWAVDRGKPRSNSDHLAMLKEPNHNDLSAALGYLYRFENRVMGDLWISPQGYELEDLLHRHPNIRDSVALMKKWKDLCPKSLAAFYHYIFSSIDQDKCDIFIEGLLTGVNIDGPIWTLRERLTKRLSKAGQLSREEVVAFFAKTWNAFYEGRELKTLRYKYKGKTKEEFPTISGADSIFFKPTDDNNPEVITVSLEDIAA
jgi:hypothetical protein